MQNKFTGRGDSYINTRRIQNKELKDTIGLVGPDPELECGKGDSKTSCAGRMMEVL
jgi:hypothetical protein